MKRIVKIISVLLVITTLICTASISACAESLTADEYGFVDVGDNQIEYAVYGKKNAQPLVLIPGNSNDMHALDCLVPALSEKYKVICFSTRGTGKTNIGEQDLTFELEAEDLSKILDYLSIEKTYVYGFSDGGNLAIIFTLLYPERVEKLCIQSPNINIYGTKLFTQLQYIWQYTVLCIECKYKTDPSYISRREIKGMMAYQPNLKFSDLEQISVPTLHIYGQFDMMYRIHSKLISKHIPNCQSVMLWGEQHSSAFSKADTLIIPKLLDFFG